MLAVENNFGKGPHGRQMIAPYSVKANTLSNVPLQERCFEGTRRRYPEASTAADQSELDDDYEVSVAVHDYGKGCIAYIGDVNFEDRVIQLVSAFISTRSPKEPIDCWSQGLTEEEFGHVLGLKEQGNVCFKEGDMDEALVFYTMAIERYEGGVGKRGEQQDIFVALHSNAGLVVGKLKDWHQSVVFLSGALEVNPNHSKSLYRRALARYHMSQDDLLMTPLRSRVLGLAREDLMKIPQSDTSTIKDQRKLLRKVEYESKRVSKMEKKESEMFGVGFESFANNLRL